jgi:hypothetical protein
MAESELIVTLMLGVGLLLVVSSAVHRYTRNFIIPGVSFLMLQTKVLGLC